jgi:hypothetical protein
MSSKLDAIQEATDLADGWVGPRCPWCVEPDSEYEPPAPEHELCHSHYLEYEGLSEDSYQAMLSAERYDSL